MDIGQLYEISIDVHTQMWKAMKSWFTR